MIIPALRPSPRTSSHLLAAASLLASHVPPLLARVLGRGAAGPAAAPLHTLAKRIDKNSPQFIVFACLIPILVLLSGLFAGLTLGYMSLDETQLNVLSISGTPQQKLYASKIKPIRKNGHLLLVTLLISNMVVNETLPVISDPVLGGGVESVVVSTVLIVIFSEVIPQSVCTRYGLAVGATMAPFVSVLLWTVGFAAWPVAKLLDYVLGPHHGIIYRRGELKELINMHSSTEAHGGDLKHDTVAIISATLDLQEKVVKNAMTPIKDVFMLSIDAKLDWETLRRVCLTGHSRVPVYEEVDVPFGHPASPATATKQKVKKIVGILLVKHCVMLDPKDAVPVRKIPLNKVPFVPQNESLLGIMDRFQEGRSHMAIVTRFSHEKAASVKKVVKTGLTQRIRNRVGMGDSSDSSDTDTDDDGAPTIADPNGDAGASTSTSADKKKDKRRKASASQKSASDGTATLTGSPVLEKEHLANVGESGRGRSGRRPSHGHRQRHYEADGDAAAAAGALEMGPVGATGTDAAKGPGRTSFQLPRPSAGLEQAMPADAVLAKAGAEEFLQSFDPAVAPLGIITLEDVVEELIGEEIYDEFDAEGDHAPLSVFMPTAPPPAAPPAVPATTAKQKALAAGMSVGAGALAALGLKPPILKRNPSAPQLGDLGLTAAGVAPAIAGTAASPPPAATSSNAGLAAGTSGSGSAGGTGSAPPKSATSTPTLKPLALAMPLAIPALPALRNLTGSLFSSARSRSAPPTPRVVPKDKEKGHSQDKDGEAEKEKDKDKDGVDQHPTRNASQRRNNSTVIAEEAEHPTRAPSPAFSTLTQPAEPVLAPTFGLTTSPSPLPLSQGGSLTSLPPAASPAADDVPQSISGGSPRAHSFSAVDAPRPHLHWAGAGPATVASALALSPAAPVAPRSASPAPSLEARLLSTRRRAVAAAAAAAAGGTGTPPPLPALALGHGAGAGSGGVGATGGGGAPPLKDRVPSAGVKGARFKSSPLGGEQRAGVVVAEEVMRGLRGQSQSQSPGQGGGESGGELPELPEYTQDEKM